jgi:hypothetical protein
LRRFEELEIVEIVDKKADRIRGYFLDSKYASFVQELATKEREHKNTHSSLAGSLHSYAKPELIDEEQHAWRRHIGEKYRR